MTGSPERGRAVPREAPGTPGADSDWRGRRGLHEPAAMGASIRIFTASSKSTYTYIHTYTHIDTHIEGAPSRWPRRSFAIAGGSFVLGIPTARAGGFHSTSQPPCSRAASDSSAGFAMFILYPRNASFRKLEFVKHDLMVAQRLSAVIENGD